MTDWNKKTEKIIRDLGDHNEKMMKDLLNPKTTVTGSMLRIVFRAAVRGKLLKRRVHAAGMTRRDPLAAMQAMVDLAEKNGSDAGEKLKKALPVMKKVEADLAGAKGGFFKRFKELKKKGYTF